MAGTSWLNGFCTSSRKSEVGLTASKSRSLKAWGRARPPVVFTAHWRLFMWLMGSVVPALTSPSARSAQGWWIVLQAVLVYLFISFLQQKWLTNWLGTETLACLRGECVLFVRENCGSAVMTWGSGCIIDESVHLWCHCAHDMWVWRCVPL